MNLLNSRKFNLSILLVLLSFIDYSKFPFLHGELGLIEILQIILIAFSIGINLFTYKLQLKYVKRWIYNLKNFFLVFLFYEEISFITANKVPFFSSLNENREFNFHNANILWKSFENFTLLGVDRIEIFPYTIITAFILLLIGFGSYFKIISKFQYLFLEKNNSIYSLIYVGNLIFSYLFRHLNFINSDQHIIIQEPVELFLYLILYIDICDKIKNFKKLSLRADFRLDREKFGI